MLSTTEPLELICRRVTNAFRLHVDLGYDALEREMRWQRHRVTNAFRLHVDLG